MCVDGYDAYFQNKNILITRVVVIEQLVESQKLYQNTDSVDFMKYNLFLRKIS